MDVNDNIDDPKLDVARLFQETDMMDLHYHKYTGTQKPATQQRGSNAINVIAGSPLSTPGSALSDIQQQSKVITN